MSGLVLSLFPGMDVLGMGFEADWCVVHARDYIFGGDVRNFHPPAGKFDGIIGGDPCQSHSSLANLVRAKGLTPKFPDLTPAFAAVIEQARPAWFLRENVPKAPDIEPEGYEVTSFLLDNCWLGEAQMRKRRFWFGWPQERGPAPNLWRWIETATFEFMESIAGDQYQILEGTKACASTSRPVSFGEREAAERLAKQQAVSADSRTIPFQIGGSGKIKSSVGIDPPKRTLGEMLELQGLPPDFLDEAPYTMSAKRKLVGNAVPLPMAKAIAKAVKEALR